MVYRTEIKDTDYFQSRYHYLLAPPHLRADIHHFWLCSAHFEAHSERRLPHLHRSWLCVLEGPGTQGEIQVFEGPQDLAYQRLLPADTVLLGVRFTAAGQRIFQDLDLADLAQQLRMHWAQTPCFTRLTQVLTEHCVPKKPGVATTTLRNALLLLREQPERSIASVAQTLHCSERSLRRYFQQGLGLSPKSCSQILRLRAALIALQTGTFTQLDLAYEDYAHFSRSFKALMGCTPSQWGQV